MIRRRFGALALLLALAAATAIASAAPITLYDGSIVNARLTQTIGSSSANVGDVFTMDVIPPYPSGDPAFQGATISGVVAKVVRAGQGRNPEVVLEPRYLRMPDGSVANVYGTVTGIQANKSSQETAAKAIGGALVGMLVGNAIGKTIFHTGAGGAIGFIGGGLAGANNKSNFTIPAGANATIQLSRTITIRRQSGP
ncbi:MAG TPA: hypothetical protein VMF61_03490 [Candidatus Acidoferrales bacterium]|nr:hypothetical protein [Candidatus Acidoferrales bacterium]